MTTLTLKPSGDRKVTPLIRVRATKQDVRVRNSFGLPAGVTCPGKTPFCDGCYALATETQWPSVTSLVHHNYALLRACGDDVVRLVQLLDGVVSVAVMEGASTYRIHWDGDFYSAPYSTAWATVCRAYPNVQFWAYTRSFDYVDRLVGIDNLALYLSVDEWNVLHAVDVLRAYPSLHVAACATTSDDAQVLLDKLERGRAARCPENVKRIPLVMALDGKRSTPVNVGDDAQGACNACRLCVDGVADVRFATAKR